MSPSFGTVKVIGDFEGDLLSPYTVEDGDDPGTDPDPLFWIAEPGSTPQGATIDYISVNDPDYVGGVTSGQQALRLTHPTFWSGHYLRLNSDLPFLTDTANFPYLMFDVTTFGNPSDPNAGPADRQVFTIFNGSVTPDWPTGWYDANNDSDIQQDPAVAPFTDPFLTTTVVVDMTAPAAVNGDGMNFLNSASQAVLDDHLDGTPIDPLYWQMLLLFMGNDAPANSMVETVIDNIRFCSDLDCTEDVVSGDFTGPQGTPDGAWDTFDLDLLSDAIANGSTDLAFDMNGDGEVNLQDITDANGGWLAVGGEQNPDVTGGAAFLVGDANLDGDVSGTDFVDWNTNKFTFGTAWSDGNFNGDTTIDGQDFVAWNGNKFMSSSDLGSAVPEPNVGILSLASLLGFWTLRVRRYA
ncbi:MAG: hypothetical protein AAGF97_05230 [Planctomycetota bacterium]